jgi:hypothetical protein
MPALQAAVAVATAALLLLLLLLLQGMSPQECWVRMCRNLTHIHR